VKTYVLGHKAGAVVIAFLVAMPLVAAPFDKAGTVLVAELVSLFVTVGGAVLRQRLHRTRAGAPADDSRHIRWGNVAAVTALILVAFLLALSGVEAIIGRQLSEVVNNTGGRFADNSASPQSHCGLAAVGAAPSVVAITDRPRQTRRA
jgi:hypothetical protein